MASLQHATEDGRDSWKLRFYLNKKRKVIGLGTIAKADAEEAKESIEYLIECSDRSRTPCKSTRQWLDRIPNGLHSRLAALGLCEARVVRDLPTTVIAYCRSYIAGRKDWYTANSGKQFKRGHSLSAFVERWWNAPHTLLRSLGHLGFPRSSDP
ncbi:hypothetical protein EC9_29330 [Rosistilla ulvae]|uniref:Uncharacterized protein n=1 Tax=Rosistilla ulvae TaxID=1930277 RepID=A0A517M1P2_9BACT|nr:hypothetical protein EC9_29330 [Rosistilla ulvae]